MQMISICFIIKRMYLVSILQDDLMVCFRVTIIVSERLGLISMCLIIDTVALLWKPYYTVRLSRLSTERYFE